MKKIKPFSAWAIKNPWSSVIATSYIRKSKKKAFEEFAKDRPYTSIYELKKQGYRAVKIFISLTDPLPNHE